MSETAHHRTPVSGVQAALGPLTDQSWQQFELTRDFADRARLVIRARWLLLALVGGYGALSALFYVAGGFREVLFANLTVPVAAVVVTAGYNVLLQINVDRIVRYRLMNLLQLLIDIAAVTVIIHFSGGVLSWFWAVYLLVTLEAAVLLDRKRDAWLVGGCGALLHGGLLTAEYYRMIPPVAMPFVDASLQHTMTYEFLAWAWVGAMNAAVALVGGFLMDAVREREQALRALSVTDDLTGLHNRSYFYRRLDGEIARCQKHHRLVSLLAIEVDHFRQYNEQYGHQEADRLLRSLAAILTSSLQHSPSIWDGAPIEVVCRMGGAEFFAILPEAAQLETRKAAEKMRDHLQNELAQQLAERVRARIDRYVADRRSVTLTIGVATYAPDCKRSDDLVRKAAGALRQAKEAGGNRVGVAGEG